jgi:hypothetical protein
MNGIAQVKEEYKQAARDYIRHINDEDSSYQAGNFIGVKRALICLGVDNNELNEMYFASEEEVQNEWEQEELNLKRGPAEEEIIRQFKDAGGIYKLAAEAAEKELEQEEPDAAERPLAQARVEAGTMRTKGLIYPKVFPYFLLHGDDILKQCEHLRLGKITTFDTKKRFFIVEDEYFAGRFANINDALELFNENVKINNETMRLQEAEQ